MGVSLSFKWVLYSVISALRERTHSRTVQRLTNWLEVPRAASSIEFSALFGFAPSPTVVTFLVVGGVLTRAAFPDRVRCFRFIIL